MQIQIADISVEIVKKKIKNMHLSVLPPDGKVRVSAPLAMSDDAIAMFVKTKLGSPTFSMLQCLHMAAVVKRAFSVATT